ncbi:MAG TPA: 6,7-dimethyl-8-ribityllumazine synthase [Acidimicrobiales bacterium]|nr:6,7-dimethyl-8-ribityllumazine synthase [Acidimicrobiales bacterium]
MSSDLAPEGPLKGTVGKIRGDGVHVGIAAARFNGRITQLLLEGALERLQTAGADPANITVAWAPGAFELPLLAQTLADGGADAVICLGAVIRGDTAHFDFVAGECAAGIQRAALDADIPVIFGVLTTDTVEQALARCGGEHGHKGKEAVEAALEMVDVLRQLARGTEAAPEDSAAGPRLYKA